MEKKVIVRLRGGLGNQLFSFAAARRMAHVNGAELVLDTVTGFIRDKEYRRTFALSDFCVPGRRATRAERLEPFEWVRRGVLKRLARLGPLGTFPYIEQRFNAFDSRLLDLKINSTVYLDGLWQSEKYFQDIAEMVRADIKLPQCDGLAEREIEDLIQQPTSVCVHVRWFDEPSVRENAGRLATYYRSAFDCARRAIAQPTFIIFSDQPVIPPFCKSERIVLANRSFRLPQYDLALMAQARHIIMAGSTFSWWAAWLNESWKRTIICPSADLSSGGTTAWGFAGQIPSRWIQL